MKIDLDAIEEAIGRHQHGFVEDARGDCVECGEGPIAHSSSGIIERVGPLIAWAREAEDLLGRIPRASQWAEMQIEIQALLARLEVKP